MGVYISEEDIRAMERMGHIRVISQTPARRPLCPPPQEAETPAQPPKRQKYGNRSVLVDGMRFDSQHEAAVYQDLALRVRAGELKTVLRQVAFDLPGGIRYIADFVAVRQDNTIVVYDAKSEITKKNRVYINKKKQMQRCCGIEITEV